tara:strand:- start:3036 stop:4643 length:1608 start_codon:yes stop_codon:yes gene_type:complete
MQTPGRQVESTSSMLGGRRGDGASRNTVATSKLLQQVDKLSQNVTVLRGQLETDRRDRLTFDNKKDQLLRKEKKSLEDLKAATIDFRKIIGVAAGASALRQFSQGDIGGGLQDTAVAITAFLPEIIGITQNIVVGGLATRGLLGGGRGLGAAGAVRGMGGKAGLLALPLLALAPLLMGAGRQNNQSNAPTAEFRREQQTRRIRKDTIAAPDTLRFDAQLDKFDRILSSLGRKEDVQLPEEIELNLEEEGEKPERNMNDKISSFIDLLNPLQGTKDFFGNLFGIGPTREEVKQRGELIGLDKLNEAFAKMLINMGLIDPKSPKLEELRKIEEEREENNTRNRNDLGDSNLSKIDTSNFEAGAFSDITEEDIDRENALDSVQSDTPFISMKEQLKKISGSLAIGDDNVIDFSSIIKDTEKATKLSSTVTNFLNFIENDFIPNTDEKNIQKNAENLMGSVLNKVPEIKKESLENAPPLIKTVFGGMFGDDGQTSFIDEAKTQFHGETGNAVGEVFVDPNFKRSVDRFINGLMMGIVND